MRRLFRGIVLCRFSTIGAKGYEKYLNEHIKKSLGSVCTASKIKCRASCEHYFQKITQTTKYQQDIIKTRMNMIFSASFQLQNFDQQREHMCEMILSDQIKSQSQLDRVLKFIFREIKFNSSLSQKDIKEFIQMQETKVKQFLKDLNDWQKVQQTSSSAQNNTNSLCKRFRSKYPAVDSKFIYDSVNTVIKNTNRPNNTNHQTNESRQMTKHIEPEENKFWDKIQNIKPRLLKQQMNDPALYQEHLRITQGRLRFRFPPEPNGYLHIGHLKSIRMNFQTAKRLNGHCFLRYDDTNPDKQTPQFIQEIQKNIKWMGYTPDKINFTSDYFEQMIDYANRLVRQGRAYVCESSAQQIELQRKQKRQNSFRFKEKQFSQKIFPHLSPNQTLRLKLDPSSVNPTLRDPIIYRFKSSAHPKTGNKFKIYPMYDFAHCLSDSIEHIDYSLCSLQFQIRRELYYKILDMLGLYKPIVWEFSRLNIKGNVISKRKIKQLIDQNKIQGWDDPRLLTIKGMQRKGYAPDILNQFIDKVNASRSGNQKYVRPQVLERQMRKHLAKSSKKLIALRNPYRISLVKSKNTGESTEPNDKKYSQMLQSSSCVFIQNQQVQKLKNSNEVILKYAGVYKVSTVDKQFRLQKSEKSVQQCKNSNQQTPILSWLPESHIQKKVTFYSSNLVDEHQDFNQQSKRQESLFLESQFQQMFQKGEQKVFLFQRIGYFKKDQKTGGLICCVQV